MKNAGGGDGIVVGVKSAGVNERVGIEVAVGISERIPVGVSVGAIRSAICVGFARGAGKTLRI